MFIVKINVHYLLLCVHGSKVFVAEKKLLSLDTVDSMFKKLNLKCCDGDRPSSLSLSGISLATCDSNLHQHGM